MSNDARKNPNPMGYSDPATDPYTATFINPAKRVLYKTAPDGCEIYFDVHVPPVPPPAGGFPVMFTIHGGGFAGGQSNDVSKSQTNYLNDQGVVVITIDYRLAPQVTFPTIMEDVMDAWKFTHEQLPEMMEHSLNTKSVGVLGHSAGAMCTLTLGLFAQRDATLARPKCLVPFYGRSQWLPLPEGFLAERDEKFKSFCSEEEWKEIAAFMAEKPISGYPDADVFDPNTPMNPRKAWLMKAWGSGLPHLARSYTLPLSNPEIETYSVYKHADSTYPPTYFVIPTADKAVDPQDARDFDKRLKELGVESHFSEAVGANHAFDMHTNSGRFGGEWWKAAVQPALDWAIEKLKA